MDWSKPTEALIPGLEGVVLRQLYAVQTPQTAGDVHERSGIGSRNGIRYALDRLSEQGTVTRTTAGNTAIYELNHEHLAYPALEAALREYNPYSALRERLHRLVADCAWNYDHGQAPSLAIYGSVARGDARPDSDLDLLLIVPDGRDGDDPQVDDLSETLHVHVKRWTGNRAHVDVRTRSAVAEAAARRDPIFDSWQREADFVFGDDALGEALGVHIISRLTRSSCRSRIPSRPTRPSVRRLLQHQPHDDRHEHPHQQPHVQVGPHEQQDDGDHDARHPAVRIQRRPLPTSSAVTTPSAQ